MPQRVWRFLSGVLSHRHALDARGDEPPRRFRITWPAPSTQDVIAMAMVLASPMSSGSVQRSHWNMTTGQPSPVKVSRYGSMAVPQDGQGRDRIMPALCRTGPQDARGIVAAGPGRLIPWICSHCSGAWARWIIRVNLDLSSGVSRLLPRRERGRQYVSTPGRSSECCRGSSCKRQEKKYGRRVVSVQLTGRDRWLTRG